MELNLGDVIVLKDAHDVYGWDGIEGTWKIVGRAEGTLRDIELLRGYLDHKGDFLESIMSNLYMDLASCCDDEAIKLAKRRLDINAKWYFLHYEGYDDNLGIEYIALKPVEIETLVKEN